MQYGILITNLIYHRKFKETYQISQTPEILKFADGNHSGSNCQISVPRNDFKIIFF